MSHSEEGREHSFLCEWLYEVCMLSCFPYAIYVVLLLKDESLQKHRRRIGGVLPNSKTGILQSVFVQGEQAA